MRPFQPLLACFSIILVLVPAISAQEPKPVPPPVNGSGVAFDEKIVDPAQPLRWTPPHTFEKFTRPYTRRIIQGIHAADSGRLDALLRAGQIYLSLQDAIALALENNLDIEVGRYGPLVAEADLLRAQSGATLRGVQTSVSQGPSSVSVAGATTGSLAVTALAQASNSGSTAIGNAIPTFDPIFTTSLNLLHQSTPQSNTVTTGTNNLFFDSKNFTTGVQESWATGTTAAYTFNYQTFLSNNELNTLNPNRQGLMTLSLSQHLLQGFGLAVNNRNIRIARLNRKVSDLVFEQQLIATVTSIVNLYWDLVSFVEDLRVKRQALQLAQKLYEDNKKQVEIGTLARIEVTRAEAEVASREQDLTISETNVLQQETVLKNALTRNGTSNPAVLVAHVVPTDSLRLSENDPIPPLPDLMEVALQRRPELKQTRLNIETNQIGLAGSRSLLLPTLDLQAVFTNNGLAGDPNYLRVGQPNFIGPSPALVGGFGTVLAEIFRRNYPNYALGFQLNVPLRNRAAQADYTRDSLTLRQAELRERQQINQVRVDVQNAQIGLVQSRSRYKAAQKTRVLQEQALDAEQKKYQLGASTIYFVIQAQRDLATAQGAEVTAMASYMHAKVQLELVTGQTLQSHNIKLDEAKAGSVARAPDVPKP